jgi:membrane protein implicated in regulation of membrane protease activity
MMISIPLLWLIAGFVLCMMEFVIPTAFTEFTMGVSAMLVALLALVVPSFGIQVAAWLVLSTLFTVLLKRMLPSPKASKTLEDSREAKTITEIAPGQLGRVLYEGNSWQAQCEDDELAIAPNQAVYVVGRRGNTLLVLPENSIRARFDDPDRLI